MITVAATNTVTTVLVVDDMPIFRDPIAASLRLAGYHTVCAANGKEALAAAKAIKPDAILLDVAMPVMDGISCLRALRADPELARTPVILLTALSDKKFVVEAGKLGVQDYLLKSAFSMRELLSRLLKYAKPPTVPGAKSAKPGASPSPAPAPAPAAASSPVSASPALVAAVPAVERAVRSVAAVPVVQPAAAVAQTRPAAALAPAAAAHVAAPGASVPRLLTREQCVARAEKALEAKTLSGAVADVVSLAASPRSNASDLAPLIARDAMLSARVLQAANSAAYVSSRGVVSTIPEAVRHIGTATVRQIAAAMGIFDAMPASTADGFNPVRCWQHSFAVAMLCERFALAAAKEVAGGKASAHAHGPGAIPPGIAYLVGLCHDLGEILFHTHFGKEYAQVVEATAAGGRRQDDLERQMLGITRGELVQTIIQRLGLPDAIKEPIGTFHGSFMPAAVPATPSGSGAAPPAAALLRLLKVADLYANGLLLAATSRAAVAPLTKAECRLAVGKDEPQPPDLTMFRSEVFYTTGMLARLSATEAEEVMKPPFSKSPARLWVAREPSLSSLDPVTAALESMAAEVRVKDRLPDGAEAADLHGLVVMAPSDLTGGFTGADIARAVGAASRPTPVLWLVARAAFASAPQGPQPLPAPLKWPTTLERVAAFVASCALPHAAAA